MWGYARACVIAASVAAWSAACASFSADATTSPTALEGGANDAADAPMSDGAPMDSGADADDTAATMVEITTAAGGPRFAIDKTEVTIARFSEFRVAHSTMSTFPNCPGKTTLGPSGGGCTLGSNPEQPITCVDWCDAKAYCEGVGKRLCGAIGGGGMTLPGMEGNPAFDEWARACTGPANTPWPYGSSMNSMACNTSESGKGAPVPVATFAACQGGEHGLFDMSGNVEEWIDACTPSDTGTHCLVRGGGWKDDTMDSTCAHPIVAGIRDVYEDVGFRCCKSL